MIHKTAKKIHKHRLIFFFIISAMFLTYLGLNPIDIGKYYGARFSSAVGMSVGVPENPYSRLAVQLREREEALDKRESELEKRESALNVRPDKERLLIYAMATGILILFFLIIVNFILDKRHRKKHL